MEMQNHYHFMNLAINQAEIALQSGEIPVGAVLVRDGIIVCRAHNTTETHNNVTHHAEINIINEFSKLFGEKYLSETTLYVTLEPCPMCASALVWSKIPRIVFGAMDAHRGACGSRFHLHDHASLNHKIEIISGIREQECEDLLKSFFNEKRKGER